MPAYIVKKGDNIPSPPGGLEFFSVESLRSPFGFKVEKRGDEFIWVPGTEDDFRRSEAERKGMDPQKVGIKIGCEQTGPKTCTFGSCGSVYTTCQLIYNPTQNYYYCACDT